MITYGKSSLHSLMNYRVLAIILKKRRHIKANWILSFWFIMFISILGQQGGIVGGVGQALAITFPLTEEGEIKNEALSKKVALTIKLNEAKSAGNIDVAAELNQQLLAVGDTTQANDDLLWSIIIAVFTIILLVNGKFSLIENFCIILVSSFTLITILNLFALQSHEAWSIKMDDILHGLSFSFPDSGDGNSTLLTAIATFGIIGVGASEILVYPYWCTEKRLWSIHRQERSIQEWLSRANGWLRVMKWDAWGSMLVYTFCTIAFYLLGASVLGRTGLVPAGSEMIQTLSSMYNPVFGKWAEMIFLIGAVAVLFSTFFVALAGQSRMVVDALMTSGALQDNRDLRTKLIKALGFILPVLCVVCYALFPKPVFLILISGSMQALMLPIVGFAVLYFRYKLSDPRLGYSKVWDFFLWASFVSFLIVGIYQLYSKIFG